MGKKKALTLNSEEIWICLDCAQERGYRKPIEGAVNGKVTKCFCCYKYCYVMDRDDLIPPGE